MNYLDGIMSGIEVKAKIANEQFKKAEAEEEEFRQEFSKAKDTWGKRTAALDDLWKANGSKLDKPYVLSKGTLFKESFCDDCYQLIQNGCVIRCTCCKKDRCSGCDHSLHSINSYAFFHSRILLADHLGFSRQPLKPTDFVDSEGTIFHESIFISLSPFLRVITEFILRNPCSVFYSARTGVQNLRGQITSGCFFKGWWAASCCN